MNAHLRKAFGILIGLATSIIAGLAALFAFIVIGVMTGAIGICASASEQWADFYLLLALFIPVIGVWAGIAVGRMFIRLTTPTKSCP